MASKTVKTKVKTTERKQRAPNFTPKENCILVEMYEQFHKIIIGAFSSTNTAEKKEEAWKKLTENFNSAAVDHVCEVGNIKDRISNIKKLAREYGLSIRQYKTGGGPPPNPPAVYVLKMYEIAESTGGKDAQIGIGSGIESEAGTASKISNSIEDITDGEDEDSGTETQQAIAGISSTPIKISELTSFL